MNNKVTLEQYIDNQYELQKRFMINASISNISNIVKDNLISSNDIVTLVKKEVCISL